MKVDTTPLADVLLITPEVYRDERGYFVEIWQKQRYGEMGLPHDFVQDNHSVSHQGVLRGIHFQINHPQGKLVRVSAGCIFDVAVDLRPGSPTFGQWYGLELSAENQLQLWIPPGMGHAFCVLSQEAHFHYKCTDYYVPGDEGTIVWNDPHINIAWPLEQPIVSAKDGNAPFLKDWIPQLHG